jgi:hypothetical protein
VSLRKSQEGEAAMDDILIRGGQVIDGTATGCLSHRTRASVYVIGYYREPPAP